MTTFSAETYQNEYLAEGASEVNAIVTVTGSGGDTVATDAEAVEVIVVDCSGSMEQPRTKIAAARRATSTAIECLRDGVWFAVIAGRGDAQIVYPRTPGIARATAATKREAQAAVAELQAVGGTAIGSWLVLAKRLFERKPATIHHAILLTDGKNESETPEEFAAALAECDGHFQCDCRGVGTNWVVTELRAIASELLGTVDIIADPEDMEDDFRSMIDSAMGKAIADVSLRVWAPQGATVKFVKQVSPTIEDLTAKARPVNDLTRDYPTGSWGAESRDYHLCIEVKPAGIGAEMLAGRVNLVVDGEPVSQALVRAIWTEDIALSTRINKSVAHYTGQAELAQVIQEGLEARKSGDDRTATTKLGRAVQLAEEGGNDATKKLLKKVVEVEDAATGRVRLKTDVADADEMALDTRSTKTTRVKH